MPIKTPCTRYMDEWTSSLPPIQAVTSAGCYSSSSCEKNQKNALNLRNSKKKLQLPLMFLLLKGNGKKPLMQSQTAYVSKRVFSIDSAFVNRWAIWSAIDRDVMNINLLGLMSFSNVMLLQLNVFSAAMEFRILHQTDCTLVITENRRRIYLWHADSWHWPS